MFTGIVQSIGMVVDFTPDNSGARLTIDTNLPREILALGDSIAIDGCCQTIEKLDGSLCTFHALDETLSKTIFKSYRRGTKVNIEPAMALGDRLGGHIMQGHVDCTGTVKMVAIRNGDTALTLSRPAPAQFPLVPKGSIAISGVSLTVAELTHDDVTVCIIPHTWSHTTLQFLKPGSKVNLEADIIGKYLLELAVPYRSSNITMDTLAKAGFLQK